MIRSALLFLLAATSVAAAGCGSDDDPAPAGATAGAGAGAGTGAAGSGGGPGAGGSGSSSGGATGSGGSQGPDCTAEWGVPLEPKYNDLGPTYGSHCLGTNHQDIAGVEKVVFLGDSITVGTIPTPNDQTYRQVLGGALEAKFPGVEVVSCAENGARVDDLLGNQIPDCFPGVEEKKTLVIMTMGGNDLASWAQDGLDVRAGQAAGDAVAADFRNAVDALRDPAKFPNGSFVVFANVYEFTDGTGDTTGCPLAGQANLPPSYPEGAAIISHLDQLYMQTAVETKTDMVFLREHFCGHGYENENPESPCYLGPNTPRWFDISCIHPNPAGHAELATMFQQTVDE